MNYNIAVIEGDGIGPEVISQAIKVLNRIGEVFGHSFNFYYGKAGGCAIDETNNPLPKETLDLCKSMDSVLLGAVGGPKWDGLPGNMRPEQALLGLRSGLGLFCNLRPATVYSPLKEASPLKSTIIRDGIDICVVRELTGGIYFGERGNDVSSDEEVAWDTEKYSTTEISRIAHIAFNLALKRNKKVTSVDKANILESSRLWRRTVENIAKLYPEVELNHLYVDNAAMQLIRDPHQFDVILTSNMFGDILSDEASMITGSIGMLPSASLGKDNFGMYEPIHGSAPDIAGNNIANPLATILSAAMMLNYSFNLNEESKAIENAVITTLNKGYRTGDIITDGCKKVGTIEIGDLVVSEIIR